MSRMALTTFALITTGCAASSSAVRAPESAATLDLVVAATTDVHGHLRGWDYYSGVTDSTRGLTRTTSIVDSLRATAPGRVIVVDAGDLLQGNPLTYVAARISPRRPHPVIAAMNEAGYDAAAIGNHEFNYGLATLDSAIGDARFPFLAANVRAAGGTRRYPAWTIVERAGVKVGIIGATTPGSMVWDRDNLQGRVAIGAIVPAVKEVIAEVRAAGADVIVVVVHSGLSGAASYDTVATGLSSENVAARIAHEGDGVDLVVYGHSHREMADTTIGTTLLMQPKNWAASVAVAHLGLVRDGRRWRVRSRRGELVHSAGHPEADRVLGATQAAHDATVTYAETEIGHTEAAWRGDSARVQDTPLTDFVLEVERSTAGTDLSSTAAFSLGASLPQGPVTVAAVARLYPYENTLKAIRITGRQLREYLEHSARYFGTFGSGEPPVDPDIPGYNFDIVSGAEYTIDLTRPPGTRITSLLVKGRAVSDADEFTMALNNYRQAGGGGYSILLGAPVVYESRTEIRQLLIDEVKRRGTLRTEDYFSHNWSLLPREAAVAAYAAMHRILVKRDGQQAPAPRATARARGARRLRIIATNDFHGALEARPDASGVMRGGAAPMAAAIASAERECAPECATILLDGGDMFQGTPASNLAHGRPVVQLYNLLGYAAAAVGNHEFDWGQDTLRARIREARFAILGANVRFTDGRDVEWIGNDTIVERMGLRIGIIGLALEETPVTTRPSNVTGLRFDDPVPVVDSTARALRSRGADAVIVVAHIGAFCSRDRSPACRGEIVDLANGVTERVDAIVSGHTHSRVDAVINGIPIVQARSSGRALGVVDIVIDSDTAARSAAAVEVRDVISRSGSQPSSAPGVDSIVQRAVASVAGRMNRRIAEVGMLISDGRPQQSLGKLIADAQRAAARTDAAFMNSGGIRADLRKGTATYASLYEIQPFGNTLVRLTVRGRDLLEYLEDLVSGGGEQAHVSGMTVTYNPTRPRGTRVSYVRFADGRALTPSGKYTVAMNDYMASVGTGLKLARAAIRNEQTGIIDLDALVSHLQSMSQPIVVQFEPRVVARP